MGFRMHIIQTFVVNYAGLQHPSPQVGHNFCMSPAVFLQ